MVPAGSGRFQVGSTFYFKVKPSCKQVCRLSLRPGSDAVLHMSRIEFNELSSCEVRRLNQFETADIIRIGLTVLHAWLSRE